MNEQIAKMMGWTLTKEAVWLTEDGCFTSPLLVNFTSSLDACFKWVAPYLNSKGYCIFLVKCDDGKYSCDIRKATDESMIDIRYGRFDRPAEAFCKAVMEVGCE